MQRPLIVIFGAAVRPDGRPSPTLARRIAYAAQAARAWPEAPVLCSGAAGRAGPSEASVMAEALLALGVEPGRLALDEASRDTFDSVVAAARQARGGGHGGCVVCSDRYHLPRIRLLLATLGIATRPGPAAPGRGGVAWTHWTRMRLREGAAIPYDLALVFVRRRKILAALPGGGSLEGPA